MGLDLLPDVQRRMDLLCSEHACEWLALAAARLYGHEHVRNQAVVAGQTRRGALPCRQLKMACMQ